MPTRAQQTGLAVVLTVLAGWTIFQVACRSAS
jgi:hypothetical protein